MHRRTSITLFILVVSLATNLLGSGTAASDFFPGTRYDPAVPTLAEVVGFDWGENITTHAECEKRRPARGPNCLVTARAGRGGLFTTW